LIPKSKSLNASLARGQSVLELTLVGFWVTLFFGLMYYIATVLEVGQKQTMLLRNQAFIELGNYSYFGLAGHGKDDVKDAKSQVKFSLGTKAQGVKVDLDKVEDFKKAVDGDLELDGVLSRRNDPYWNAFQFPKRRTTVKWLTSSGNSSFESEITAHLSIAHNRSLDLTRSIDPADYKMTGMYSGGLSLRQYIAITKLKDRVEMGLIDNTDQIKKALKQLVKNDSSLADEAEAIENNFNVGQDAITGGAVASLINLAISAIAQAGFEALGKALEASSAAGSAGSSAGGSAGSAASEASQQGIFDRMLGSLTDPYSAAGNAASGSLFTAPLESITSPITSGFSSVAEGLATGGSAGLFQTMQGLSQLGQTVQLGMGLAGQDTRIIGMVSAGLAIPAAISNGVRDLNQAFYSPSAGALTTASATGEISKAVTDNTINWVGVAQALPGITQPITTFLALAVPELSQVMGIINTSVGVLNAAVNLPGQLDNLSAAKGAEVLTTGGQLTAGVGQLVAGVGQITGKGGEIGNYMMLAGGAMQGAGAVGKFVNNLKDQGIDVSNPLDVAGRMVKSNFENVGKSLNGMKDSLANSVSGIGTGLSNIFSSTPQIAEGKDFLKSAKELGDKSTGVFSDDRFTTSTSIFNTLKAEKTIDELQENFGMQMKGYGEDPTKYQGDFANIKKGFETLQGLKSSETLTASQLSILDAAKASSDNLNSVFAQRFGKDIMKQNQLRGMMYQNNQWSLAKNMLEAGQTYDDVKKMEAEQNGKSDFGWVMTRLKAGAKTNEMYQEQVMKAYNILVVDAVDGEYKNAKERKKAEYKAATKLADAAESLSIYNPIYSEDKKTLKESAGKSAEFLKTILYERTDLSPTDRKRFEAAQQRIESISNGRAAFESPRERLGRIRNQVNERVELFVRTREVLERCAIGNCQPEIN